MHSLPSMLLKDQEEMLALIDSGSEINIMSPTYISKLGLKVCPTHVGAQKVNGSIFKMFGMVLASF